MSGRREFRDPIAVIAVVLLVGLIVLTVFQVASRYLFKAPISFSEEVGRILFIWASFLGASIVMKDDEHMNLDLLTGQISPAALRIVRIVVYTLIAAFCMVVTVFGLKLVASTTTQFTAITRIPMAYIYLVLPVSGGYMFVFSLLHLIRTIRREAGESQGEGEK